MLVCGLQSARFGVSYIWPAADLQHGVDVLHVSLIWFSKICFCDILVYFLPCVVCDPREPEYYDYGHGDATQSYDSYGESGCFFTLLRSW